MSNESVDDPIHEAVELIRERHQVRELSAYTMLVQAAVDQHLTVTDTAARMIEDAERIPAPRS